VEATGGTSVRLMLENIPAENPSEESKAASEDKAILYKQAVELIRAEFSERDWQAFRGVVIEDKSTAEVAASLGVAPNVIYLAKSRVLRRLKEEFTGLID
jgi:RNA polymerase sigma-70 factor (ECF subfamily)